MQNRSLTRLVAAAALAVAASTPALAQQVVLKVHHFLPGTSNVHKNLITPWCDKINKESNDRLKCQIYPAMQLGGTPAQLFDQARDGVADIVWTIPTYSAGRFVKSEVFELPFFTRSAKGSSKAYWEFVQKNALDEYAGVKPLWLHTNDGSSFHLTSANGIRTLDELKGLKIRAATRLNSRMLAALGATPVQMPLPAVPEAMAKGVIDGAMVPWEGVPAAKLQEIAKSHVDVPAGQPKFANSIFAFVMNQARYDSLPADLKKVIDTNSGAEVSAWAGEKGFDSVVAPFHKLATERGNQVVALPEAELARWAKATAEIDDQWIKEVSAKGANGAALLEQARGLAKQYDH
ncbi:TRAP transporter substrate-binding protein [Ramlibacter sp.]|uniref:TRAP transporter substrate-binding protein n=1 Tax=Ramlibacter sp. TaxID=1917967 RepID=UPI002D6BA10E|nr:TRAP transporter substrate-binding protein [Ramlibacter sp.]HYD77636.1 TRAP transporter substrate-binding protein [Ramlibacter sp.]